MHFRRHAARNILFVCAASIICVLLFPKNSSKADQLFGEGSKTSRSEKARNTGNKRIVKDSSSANVGEGTCDGVGNIEVQASSGTLGPTGYVTLKDVFDAINAGIHQGNIAIDVCGNTIETATASINASGGSSSYTSIVIRPAGSSRLIEGTVTGAIVKLNGADNVTIDGRIGGAGTNRDLTIRNNSTATGTAAIWLNSIGAGAGATNNTIRNLEIAAGVTQNTSAATTFGVLMSGGSIQTTAAGNDNDNNSFIANRIIRVRYGIVTRGNSSLSANLNENIQVTDNIIGPTEFGPDQIGKVGILMQADSNSTVSRNTIQYVGGDFANTPAGGSDRIGIGIGSETWSDSISTMASSSYIVTKNTIINVIEERAFSAVGILLANANGTNGTGSIVANNFVSGVRANGTSSDQGVGIGIGGGGNDIVAFNSILMTGDVDPLGASTANKSNAGIRVANASGATHFNLTLKNNNVQVDLTSNTPGLLHHCIIVNSVNYDFGTGGMDNNNYYFPEGNAQMRTGGIGTGTTVMSSFQSLAEWKTTMSNPQDAASVQADPQFISSSDLHLMLGGMTALENAGVPIAGVTDDIDGHIRSATPEIGADEQLSPTAAAVSVSGRVLTASGRGIRNVRIVVEGGDLAWPIVVTTNSFGFYRFTGLAAGQSYIVTVKSKRFGFASPVRVVNAGDGIANLDFTAEP